MLSHFEFPSDVNKQHYMIKAAYIKEFHFSRAAWMAAPPGKATSLRVPGSPTSLWVAPVHSVHTCQDSPSLWELSPDPSHLPLPFWYLSKGESDQGWALKGRSYSEIQEEVGTRVRCVPSCAFNNCRIWYQALHVDDHLFSPLGHSMRVLWSHPIYPRGNGVLGYEPHLRWHRIYHEYTCHQSWWSLVKVKWIRSVMSNSLRPCGL